MTFIHDPSRRWRRALAGLACSAGLAGAAHAGDADLSWRTIDGGGGTSTGGAFVLRGSIGQPDASDGHVGGTWQVTGGFWSVGGVTTPPCPLDLDGSGAIDFGDLVAVLSNWGTCAGCPADLDGSGAVDFNDLVSVLAAWGPCPA